MTAIRGLLPLRFSKYAETALSTPPEIAQATRLTGPLSTLISVWRLLRKYKNKFIFIPLLTEDYY